MAAQRIDTRALINDSAFGGYQIGVFALCFIAMIIDGYDVQIIGVAAAGIRETLKLEPATLGIVITAGQVGVILGAVFLAPFADRIGRKRLMIASLLIFGAFSFLTAYATNVPALIALRVLAGIGLGSIGPAALALGAEYAPKKLKASIPSWIWAAVPTGGMIAGLSAIWLLPVWGWPSLFVVSGVLPILIAIPLGLFMPESLGFIATQHNDQREMRRIALKIAPTLPADAELYCSEEKLPGVPLKHLFMEGRALGTVLLWILFFLDYGILIFFLSWVPTLIKIATGSTTALGTSLAFWNVGSIFCSFGIRLARRSLRLLPRADPEFRDHRTLDVGDRRDARRAALAAADRDHGERRDRRQQRRGAHGARRQFLSAGGALDRRRRRLCFRRPSRRVCRAALRRLHAADALVARRDVLHRRRTAAARQRDPAGAAHPGAFPPRARSADRGGAARGADLTFALAQPLAPKRMSNPMRHDKPIVASGLFDSNIRKMPAATGCECWNQTTSATEHVRNGR
jgi:MFS family permease